MSLTLALVAPMLLRRRQRQGVAGAGLCHPACIASHCLAGRPHLNLIGNRQKAHWTTALHEQNIDTVRNPITDEDVFRGDGLS